MSNINFSKPLSDIGGSLDFSKPLITRGGHDVTILADQLRGQRPVLGLLLSPGRECDRLVRYFRNGRVCTGYEHPDDLQNKLIIETRDAIVVFRPDGNELTIGPGAINNFPGCPIIKFSCDFVAGHFNGGRITQLT